MCREPTGPRAQDAARQPASWPLAHVEGCRRRGGTIGPRFPSPLDVVRTLKRHPGRGKSRKLVERHWGARSEAAHAAEKQNGNAAPSAGTSGRRQGPEAKAGKGRFQLNTLRQVPQALRRGAKRRPELKTGYERRQPPLLARQYRRPQRPFIRDEYLPLSSSRRPTGRTLTAIIAAPGQGDRDPEASLTARAFGLPVNRSRSCGPRPCP